MREAVVIGASAGGMSALKAILKDLPPDFPAPVMIVQHIAPQAGSSLSELLDAFVDIRVKEAEDKDSIRPGMVYIAPAGYHLLVEPDRTLSLSVDERVNFSCPAIDVLFDSAADTFGAALIGVVLTGANADGSAGLIKIAEAGGLAVVQSPETAESPYMPSAALQKVAAAHRTPLAEIAGVLLRHTQYKSHDTGTDN
jgi:two-component system chemotaxis response regulator CheB